MKLIYDIGKLIESFFDLGADHSVMPYSGVPNGNSKVHFHGWSDSNHSF